MPATTTATALADGALEVRRAFFRGIRPPRPLSVAEWADTHRILSPVASREAGQWRTDRTPYLRELMDALGPDCPAESVVFMKGAQVGGSEAGHNWLGWIISEMPGPTMVVLPTVDLGKRWSKQRLEPMLTDSPKLAGKVSSAKRDKNATVLLKTFPGGVLVIVGANSGAGLRSMPVRFLVLDEVDAFPGDTDGEGDPTVLAERGTRTYGRAKKVLYISTPTISSRSRIEREFRTSDRRYYHVPCPLCGEFQRLEWKRIVYDAHDWRTARYRCAACEGEFGEHHKTDMLEAGRWIPEAPELSDERRGYHLSALYSPLGWRSWKDVVKLFLKATGKLEGDGEGSTKPDVLRVWTNQDLGESYHEKGEAPPWERLYNRREDYRRGTVPDEVAVLTAGVDVQADRLECDVWGWADGLESWLVDHAVLLGDPAKAEVWRELEELLDTSWAIEGGGGTIRIERTAVDCGFLPQSTRAWVRSRPLERTMGVKGRGKITVPAGQPTKVDVSLGGRKIRRGVQEWPVGTDPLKSELYGWLRMGTPTNPEETGYPDGYVHFPRDLPEEWFRQLCAEQLMPRKNAKGYLVYEWEQVRDRNEALDCRVYARAAGIVMGMDRWSEEDWKRRREQRSVLSPGRRSTKKKRARMAGMDRFD